MGAWYISLSKITLYKVDREMDDILVLPGFVETQFVNYKTYQETIILARLLCLTPMDHPTEQQQVQSWHLL